MCDVTVRAWQCLFHILAMLDPVSQQTKSIICVPPWPICASSFIVQYTTVVTEQSAPITAQFIHHWLMLLGGSLVLPIDLLLRRSYNAWYSSRKSLKPTKSPLTDPLIEPCRLINCNGSGIDPLSPRPVMGDLNITKYRVNHYVDPNMVQNGVLTPLTLSQVPQLYNRPTGLPNNGLSAWDEPKV